MLSKPTNTTLASIVATRARLGRAAQFQAALNAVRPVAIVPGALAWLRRAPGSWGGQR